MRILLVGNPNTGKSSLFRALTGKHTLVANHAGVTFKKQASRCKLENQSNVELVDLPGLHSLDPYSAEERITLAEINTGKILFVLDATQLKRNLYLLTELIDAGYRPLIALTQIDLAEKQGIHIDHTLLAKRLCPESPLTIIPISTKTGEGIDKLKSEFESCVSGCHPALDAGSSTGSRIKCGMTASSVTPKQRYDQINEMLRTVIFEEPVQQLNIDKFLLHPVWGLLSFFAIFGVLFLSLFAIGKPMAGFLESIFQSLGFRLQSLLAEYPLMASLLVDGVLAGIGTLVAFMPLIALLFFFLGILEESGYLARANFLLDRVMSKAGLSGRAFVPMLSGFACAIPAILSTRIIRSKPHRLIAMMALPFLSCSARLPLYALLTAAFFSTWVGALVMLGLYLLGLVAAFIFGLILKQLYFKDAKDELILEFPSYRFPQARPLFQHVWRQLSSFLTQAGTLILSMSVIMWALFNFPRGADIEHSYAGILGHLIEPLITPLGFDWKLGVGLLASFSAREVMVSTLGVIYGLDADWALIYSPLVALSLLVFFALAMQCSSTFIVMRRETNSWRWPIMQFVVMTGTAWMSSFVVFQTGRALGF
ncbi:MAG: ferrous iron transport protein B [Deltaproteobacteria bacterium]|nr:ferrous iron transport protein B [Deltaproteobacteria bacterium]